VEPVDPSQQFAASRFEFLTVDSHREEMLMLIPSMDVLIFAAAAFHPGDLRVVAGFNFPGPVLISIWFIN